MWVVVQAGSPGGVVLLLLGGTALVNAWQAVRAGLRRQVGLAVGYLGLAAGSAWLLWVVSSIEC